MINGTGSLQLNVPTQKQANSFHKQQEVIIRRPTSRTGPKTNQILVGRILAFGEGNTATVSVLGPAGTSSQRVVNLKDISIATPDIKRKSIQFNPQYRQGW